MWVGIWSRECSPFWTRLVTAILTTNLLRWEVRTKEGPRTQCTKLASIFSSSLWIPREVVIGKSSMAVARGEDWMSGDAKQGGDFVWRTGHVFISQIAQGQHQVYHHPCASICVLCTYYVNEGHAVQSLDMKAFWGIGWQRYWTSWNIRDEDTFELQRNQLSLTLLHLAVSRQSLEIQ